MVGFISYGYQCLLGCSIGYWAALPTDGLHDLLAGWKFNRRRGKGEQLEVYQGNRIMTWIESKRSVTGKHGSIIVGHKSAAWEMKVQRVAREV